MIHRSGDDTIAGMAERKPRPLRRAGAVAPRKPSLRMVKKFPSV
jgi:hypothetical protein